MLQYSNRKLAHIFDTVSNELIRINRISKQTDLSHCQANQFPPTPPPPPIKSCALWQTCGCISIQPFFCSWNFFTNPQSYQHSVIVSLAMVHNVTNISNLAAKGSVIQNTWDNLNSEHMRQSSSSRSGLYHKPRPHFKIMKPTEVWMVMKKFTATLICCLKKTSMAPWCTSQIGARALNCKQWGKVLKTLSTPQSQWTKRHLFMKRKEAIKRYVSTPKNTVVEWEKFNKWVPKTNKQESTDSFAPDLHKNSLSLWLQQSWRWTDQRQDSWRCPGQCAVRNPSVKGKSNLTETQLPSQKQEGKSAPQPYTCMGWCQHKLCKTRSMKTQD